jgi:hypothetical protein
MKNDDGSDLSTLQFNNIIHLNNFLYDFTSKVNQKEVNDFLGLSPEQMHGILNNKLNLNNDLFCVQDVDIELLLKVPIIEQSLYLLNKLKDSDLKATQKGNLPKSIVQDLYYRFYSEMKFSFLPHTEEDSQPVNYLRLLLILAGYMKIRSKKYSLTDKGKMLLNIKNYNNLFKDIFIVFSNKFNWAYGDRYPDFNLIQTSCSFNIFMIYKKAQNWIAGEELGRLYVQTFPALQSEAEACEYRTASDQISSCFNVRFLERFSMPLGLLESKEDGDKPHIKNLYKLSPIFLKMFKFKTK